MHITTPTEVTDVLWEGALEPPAPTMRGVEGVQASIGSPAQWADGQLLGEKWQPPTGGDRYYLARLAFSLRATRHMEIAAADFCLSLRPQAGQHPVVFSAYPLEQLEQQARPVTLGFGLDFNLGAAEASLAKAETTIDFGYAVPIIRTDGLAESTFCWRYARHPKHLLVGSRQMYAVIALPDDMPTALAVLELIVTAAKRDDFFKFAPPQSDAHKLRWVVGERA
jgi:hypothetical protein